jgi:hypothetical protein
VISAAGIASLVMVMLAADPDVRPDRPYEISFPATEARFVRLLIHESIGGQAGIDELEIYGPAGGRNLALAANGAKAHASSLLPGYAIHRIANLNDGLYGNDHSWIAGLDREQWAEIELPAPAQVAKVVISRDRSGRFKDRVPVSFEVRMSADGKQWKTVKKIKTGQAHYGGFADVPLPEPYTWDDLLRYAFLNERATADHISRTDQLSPFVVDRPALPGQKPYWGTMARLDPLSRALRQMEDMIERFAATGLDVAGERAELRELRKRQAAQANPSATASLPQAEKEEAADRLYLDVRAAKRRLMLRDPELAPLEKLLFVKRHPYQSSHNYSDILDSAFRPGGGVCVLDIPRRDGRLKPAAAKLRVLFDAARGIARDPVASFDAGRIWFAWRPSDRGPEHAYWHVMSMKADGTDQRQLTDGPFHDYYPCPLPDGGLAFISTRCKCRFLCWRPQAFVLFRLDAGGGNIAPLSYANLSEWAPAMMRDGRIIWTRSEYLDKGADFGHTLWAIRPDGTQPLLLFGNNTRNCYMNGREVPGTSELCCTLISHGGDHNGPIGLIDVGQGPFGREAVTNITPDVTPQYHMSWATRECFRDPVPISRDYFLVSHAPADKFGLYVIDRYGNRELLYLDATIGSMSPTPLRAVPPPPVLSGSAGVSPAALRAGGPRAGEGDACGQFTVADVYRGLAPAVKRGTVKYIRVCQEIRADLERLPDGRYRSDHEPFMDFYASPTHILTGPSGWPSYVAKAALGIVPVDEDGSANFYAPAGKVLYFEALGGNLDELQRMRSVVQLQPGEKRSCIGCHEDRTAAPPVREGTALRRPPSQLEQPSWGAVAFSYPEVVQPVLDARCVSCHNAADKHKLDLSGTLGADHIPASYRTLISQGWVHYFNMVWGMEHSKAEPLTFGTRKSRLRPVLDGEHYGVRLSRDEMHRLKCWIDLNCPLWPDYAFRQKRKSPLPPGEG